MALPIPADKRNEIIAKALESVRDGMSFPQMSEKFGLAASTLNHWLLSTVPVEYREAQEAGVIAKLVANGEKIESATSHLDVSRAREATRFWCWVAERTMQRFAPKQELSGPGGGPIELSSFERAQRFAFLRAQAELRDCVIDVEPTVVGSPAAALKENATPRVDALVARNPARTPFNYEAGNKRKRKKNPKSKLLAP